MLCAAMNLPAQLDTLEPPIIEPRNERVLYAARDSQGDIALDQSPRERRDGFGYGEIGCEKIFPALHRLVELVTPRL